MKLKYLFLTLATLAFFSTAQAQVKVGANPSAIGTNSSLEVEATNGNKTIVNKANGQITIQDGTQAVNKVLTSDANGNASWQILKSQTSGIYTTTEGGAYQQVNLGNNVLTFNSETADEGNNYNPATSTFTVPEDGIYYINAYVIASGVLSFQTGRIGMNLMVHINNTFRITLSQGIAFEGDWGYTGGSTVMRLTAGQQLRFVLGVDQGNTTNQQRMLDPKRHFEIMKLSN